MSNRKNIIEEVLKDFLERSLKLRFDICTCEKCKKKMLEKLLSRFPSEYIDVSNDYDLKKEAVMKKYFKEIFIQINQTIEEVSKNPPHPIEEDREEAFKRLLEKIYQDRGVDFRNYRENVLKRRIALRLLANKVDSYSEYLKILANSPQEYEKLFEVLAINVSEFFRDPPLWKRLEEILRKIIEEKNKSNEPVFIWSAGCAAGQEAYSLAILINEIDDLKIPVKIYGTDIDKDSLDKAKKARYSSDDLKNVEEELLKKYFIYEKGSFQLKEEIKKYVEFRYLDLTSSEYFSNIDMILCRNVFIYFTKPLQEQILNRFYKALRDGGYLVIGMSETLVSEAKLVFKEIDMYNRIYQKLKVKD